VRVDEFLAAHGRELPAVERLVSVLADGRLTRPSRLTLDFSSDLVVTAEGLVSDASFIGTIREMLEVLEQEMGVAVDIEFAFDGERIWLLQCRPQSRSTETEPALIPQNLDERSILFRTNKHVSNGMTPDISHIVYVDGRRYRLLSSAEQMRAVGRAVSRLNKVLPKRRFVLIGPGRWGSRGDIRQGVSVGYADISNTAALMEVADSDTEYPLDLSFGTHFFQDLVEASIRYIPIYPNEDGCIFDDRFLSRSHNELADLLPDYAALEDVLRVIDVAKVTGGKALRILLNADVNEAVGVFADPVPSTARSAGPRAPVRATAAAATADQDEHWRWRFSMAERIARTIDADRFGIKAM
jgi:pyruvate, water dikinase